MRLRPLTEDLPKPLLKVGDKSILEHSLLRYDAFGVKSINITTNYLSQKIEDFIEQKKNDYRTTIETVKESQFLGTIGAIKLVKNFSEDYILVSNSDLLAGGVSFLLKVVVNNCINGFTSNLGWIGGSGSVNANGSGFFVSETYG